MPSHISHALLIEDVLSAPGTSLGDSVRQELSSRREVAPVAVLGAQGPDIFLHNHRRKPRGFRYGAILHRKGNADLVTSLALNARDDLSRREWRQVVAFSLGYLSHIWMDRFCHPYINYHAGWRGVPDKHQDRPFMHAFLERIIDVQILRQRRNQSVQDYAFIHRIAAPRPELFRLRRHINQALYSALWSSRNDKQLDRRLANALYDSYGYYRFSEAPGYDYFAEGRKRERNGEISSRWLALVHPPEELLMIDGLNHERRLWKHPCDESRTSNETFETLYERALRRTIDSFNLWISVAYNRSAPEELRAHIGEQNLNDGIVGDPPCRRQFCDPLPLMQLFQRIKLAFD